MLNALLNRFRAKPPPPVQRPWLPLQHIGALADLIWQHAAPMEALHGEQRTEMPRP